jgi:predicted transport protein
MEAGLLEKTGKPLEHWIKVVQKESLEKHGEVIKFLKSEHDFTRGFANFVALKARAADAGSIPANDLVNAQYEKKPDLKPIYDLLLKKITALGKDIEIAPKKTSVSLRVKRQFALIQPSTKTRIDLGLKFNDKAHEGRLETSGPFGSMCTHRVQITDTKQVNKELIGWIKEAYNEAK